MSQSYPTMDQVEKAEIFSLTTWIRFLPSPSDENRPVMERIVERFREIKRADPGAVVAASKEVDW